MQVFQLIPAPEHVFAKVTALDPLFDLSAVLVSGRSLLIAVEIDVNVPPGSMKM